MLGRLLGGVATSLLFSVFEAWLIRSHTDAKISKQGLSNSFSTAAYGNSIIAIVAGLLANKAASYTTMKPISSSSIYVGGFLNPFDIALVALVVCGMLASTLWDENYGRDSSSSSTESNSDDGRGVPNWYDGLKNAFIATTRSRDIFLCGIISSLFEGSMYIFVFMVCACYCCCYSTEQKKQTLQHVTTVYIYIYIIVDSSTNGTHGKGNKQRQTTLWSYILHIHGVLHGRIVTLFYIDCQIQGSSCCCRSLCCRLYCHGHGGILF